jgi:hypothetical protein
MHIRERRHASFTVINDPNLQGRVYSLCLGCRKELAAHEFFPEIFHRLAGFLKDLACGRRTAAILPGSRRIRKERAVHACPRDLLATQE